MGQHLQAAWPDRSVEVINAGVPGELLEGSALALRSRGQQLKPQLVVVHHGPNDMVAVSGGHHRLSQQSPLRASVLFGALTTFRATRGPASGSLPDRFPTDHDRRQLRQRLDRALDQMQAPGRQLMLATHALRPSPHMDAPTLRRAAGELPGQLMMSPRSAVAWYQMWNTVVVDVSKQRRLPLARVDQAVGSDPALWVDATHFSTSSSTLAAKAVADAILTQVRP